jgi:hypothetical protein
MRLKSAIVFSALTLLASSGSAHAQDIIDEELKEKVENTEKKPDGWDLGATLGATLSFSHNSHVVGQPDGFAFQFGLVFSGFANMLAGDHEWQNTLSLQETVTRTPTIDLFLKTQDALDFSSTYLYHIPDVDWLGPFAQFSLKTQIFPGFDARDTQQTIIKTLANGTTETEVIDAQKEIDLTTWFEPLRLKQVVGMFANPITSDPISIHIQLGIGANEVFTQDGFVIDDNADTPELELVQLEDYVQAGGELEFDFGGKFNEIVTWGASASFFQPFYSSIDRGLSGIDLMTIDIKAKLSVKLAEWASLDYVFSALREPLIVNDWQIQNGLLLTIGFNVFQHYD